jgi:hypothetical protein
MTRNESSALRFVQNVLTEARPALSAHVSLVRPYIHVVLPDGAVVLYDIERILFWREKERIGLAVPGQTRDLVLEQLNRRSSTV